MEDTEYVYGNDDILIVYLYARSVRNTVSQQRSDGSKRFQFFFVSQWQVLILSFGQ